MAVEFQVLDHISTFTTLRLITGKILEVVISSAKFMFSDSLRS